MALTLTSAPVMTTDFAPPKCCSFQTLSASVSSDTLVQINWLASSVSVMSSSQDYTLAESSVFTLPFLKMFPLDEMMTSRSIFCSSMVVMRSLTSVTSLLVA